MSGLLTQYYKEKQKMMLRNGYRISQLVKMIILTNLDREL
jgi:hypothetical protein